MLQSHILNRSFFIIDQFDANWEDNQTRPQPPSPVKKTRLKHNTFPLYTVSERYTKSREYKKNTIAHRINNKYFAKIEARLKRGTNAIPNSNTVADATSGAAIMNSDPSCYRSLVMQNVTLRGGIQAGYFRKLAEHVAMKLCVELCCEEKGLYEVLFSPQDSYLKKRAEQKSTRYKLINKVEKMSFEKSILR